MNPAILMCDLELEKLTSPANIHLGLLTLDEFVNRTGRLPTFEYVLVSCYLTL